MVRKIIFFRRFTGKTFLCLWSHHLVNLVLVWKRQPYRYGLPVVPDTLEYCLIRIGNYYEIITQKNGKSIREKSSALSDTVYVIDRFELHYYTCAGCYLSMTIDNRTQDSSDSMPSSMNPGNSNGNSGSTRDDIVATPLERLIHTKWSEAKISLKGPPPPSLSY